MTSKSTKYFVRDAEQRIVNEWRDYQEAKRQCSGYKLIAHDALAPLEAAIPNSYFNLDCLGRSEFNVEIENKAEITPALDTILNAGFWEVYKDETLKVDYNGAQIILVPTEKLNKLVEGFEISGWRLKLEVNFRPADQSSCKVVEIGKEIKTHETTVYSLECAEGAEIWSTV